MAISVGDIRKAIEGLRDDAGVHLDWLTDACEDIEIEFYRANGIGGNLVIGTVVSNGECDDCGSDEDIEITEVGAYCPECMPEDE